MMNRELLEGVDKYDINAVLQFLLKNPVRSKKPPLSEDEESFILLKCNEMQHYDGKEIIQAMVEFEYGFPNRKIKGMQFSWIHLCERYGVESAEKILIHRGEKRHRFKDREMKKKVKEFKSGKVSRFYQFRTKDDEINKLREMAPPVGINMKQSESEEGEKVFQHLDTTEITKWRKFFNEKFRKGRKRFSFKAEITLFFTIEGTTTHSDVLWQKGLFFTPCSAIQFSQRFPITDDSDLLEYGLNFREVSYVMTPDTYLMSCLECEHAILRERLKTIPNVETIVIQHVEKTTESSKKKKKKIRLFRSTEEVFHSRALILGNMPKAIQGLVEKKGEDLYETIEEGEIREKVNEPIPKEEIEKPPSMLPEPEKIFNPFESESEEFTGNVKRNRIDENEIKKDGRVVIICKTKSILYAVMVEKIGAYELRVMAMFINDIMKKIKQSGL